MNDFFTLMKPELLLTAIIFILLFIKIGRGIRNELMLPVIQVLLLLNFIGGVFFNKEGNLFGNIFYTNALIVYQKCILNLGVLLISLLCSGWLLRHKHLPEFFMLMLSAQLGMFFMLSSGNFLMFYLSLELMSIPVAAMANFDLDRKISSEAAMKMILSSAFASGILLFGISLLYGITGSVSFLEIPGVLTGSALEILVLVFVFSAFAFKLSVVPFHLWTADVYEGSPVAVTAYLSVISKGAMAFAFITMMYKVFQPLHTTWYTLITLLAIATMLVGNFFALRQQNLKRFLAFSSIAQVGFILLGISSNDNFGITSVVYFILIYIFSNLAAFGVVAVISEQTGMETIDGYRGLHKTNPLLSWVMAIALFSLAGIPPTAGFFGKLFLITAGASKSSYVVLIIAALNLVISLYYYLRVVKAMFMEKNEQPVPPLKIHYAAKAALIVCAAGIVAAGLIGWVYEYILSLM